MAYYNSFIECWNAWQLLALAPEDKQTSDVIDLPKWRPPLITFDWSDPTYGRYTTITQPFYPSIRITKDMVDEMTATFNIDFSNFVQFVFKNDTALRFYITGASGGRIDINYQFVNLKTGVGGGVSGTSTGYLYDAVFAEGQPALYLFPTMFHYKDSSDPTFNAYEVWCTLYYATEWGRIRENGGQPGDPRNWIPSVMLWGENNWSDVPDWFWDGNQVDNNPDYPPPDDDDTGGFGSYDDVNDEIDVPPFPTISALGSGLVNLYSPTAAQLQAFSSWLWSAAYYDNVIKNQSSPMENIIAFGFVPINVNTVSSTFKVGNLDSTLTANACATEYIEIDCGSLDVPEHFGGFLDYNADYQIYLPYIGFKPMRADDFTKGNIKVVYHVDILTGNTQAYVVCQNGTRNKHILYSYVGNCFTELPISGANFARMKQGQMTSVMSGVTSLVGAGVSIATGNIGGAVSGVMGAIEAKQNYDLQKPDYEHGGGLSGNALFTYRTPYIIQTRYETNYPSNYKSLIGIPSRVYKTLENLSGFTKIESVIVDTLTHCTKSEKDNIINMLKEGVLL